MDEMIEKYKVIEKNKPTAVKISMEQAIQLASSLQKKGRKNRRK
jgi:hypothetical protein